MAATLAQKDEQEKAEKDAEKDDLDNRKVTSTMSVHLHAMHARRSLIFHRGLT